MFRVVAHRRAGQLVRTCLPRWSERLAFTSKPDGNFYTMGGRTSDTAGSDFQHVLQFDTTSNSWTQMASTLPDNQMNNMACGVLAVSGTPLIYCVGGSAADPTTATARVFTYDPVTDTPALLGSDDWPGDAAGTILPGGFAVANNKLYILGGFNINVASTNEIWEFDPNAAAGSRWTQKVNTPEGIMYASTCSYHWHHLRGRCIGFPGWHGDRHDQLVSASIRMPTRLPA